MTIINFDRGYLDVAVTVETAGGHSSVPTDHTSIGLLAQIVCAIENAPYSPDLTPVNRKCDRPFPLTIDANIRYSLFHNPTMWC